MFKKTIMVGAMLAAVAGAQAQTANFIVAGTINPPACTITLGGSGIADYGTNASASVRLLGLLGGQYTMAAKTFAITVACTAASPLQLAFTDNQAGKILPIDSNDYVRFGLVDGATGTSSIGSYTIRWGAAPTVDGAAAAGYLHAPSATTAWAIHPGGLNNVIFAPGMASGVIKTTGLTAPSTLKDLSGIFQIQALVQKTYVDGATGAITLNGSASVSLQYL